MKQSIFFTEAPVKQPKKERAWSWSIKSCFVFITVLFRQLTQQGTTGGYERKTAFQALRRFLSPLPSYCYHRHMTKALFDSKTIYFSGTFIQKQI